jgi:serine protease Do
MLAGAFLALTLAVGILLGSVISGQVAATPEQNAAAPVSALVAPSPVQLSGTFASIARSVEPAVVNISTVEPLRTGRRQPRSEDFEFPFDRFFGLPDEGPRAARSLGSGVIVDKRGYILTNWHVVQDAAKIQVRIDDDRNVYSAKVVGHDEETDLAVIKIEADRDLPTAKMGNSDAVQVGDWVLAFGSPFGLQATVTAGIVSAKDRVVDRYNPGPRPRQFQRMLQTDAAINPGNSGGPLVNMAGEVVGINTAILSSGRGYDGVGFALPSSAAINVYNQLLASGRVARGSIGIQFNEQNSTNPLSLKQLGVSNGIIVELVTPDSPAARAGLQPTDVITEVNGKPVKTGNDLVDPIANTPVGGKVRLKYYREGKPHEATLTVEDRTKVFPPDRESRVDEEPEEVVPVRMGLRLEELTDDLAKRVGLTGRRGVLVTSVEPGSFAEDLGFLRNDVIFEMNRKPVASAAELREALARLKKGQEVYFRVYRSSREGLATVLLAGVYKE